MVTTVRRRVLFMLVAVMALLAALAVSSVYGGNGNGGGGQGLDKANAAKEGNIHLLDDDPNIVGMAVGFNAAGQPAVKIYTVGPGKGIPRQLDGVPTDVFVTGRLVALHHRDGHGGGPGGDGGGGEEPTGDLVSIGTSTGNEGECSAGTIGARVTDGIKVYALSNNHVYASENAAPIGSNVLSPRSLRYGMRV